MKCFCGNDITIREHRDVDGDYSYSWICTNKECVLSKYLFDTRKEAEQNVTTLVKMLQIPNTIFTLKCEYCNTKVYKDFAYTVENKYFCDENCFKGFTVYNNLRNQFNSSNRT